MFCRCSLSHRVIAISSIIIVVTSAFKMLTWVLIIRAILSWVSQGHNPIEAVMIQLTEPLLRPIRNRLPSMGGLDLSMVVVILGIQFLDNSNNLPLIDHKNRNKQDNNLNNLRWVTRSENCKNLGIKEDREVKYVGVRKVKNKIKKPYRSETTFNNKKYHVGYYDSEEEAYEAYKKFNLEKFEIEII